MTTRWAGRCTEALQSRREENVQRSKPNAQHPKAEPIQSAIRNPQSAIERQLLFGIVQAATFDDLRKASAQAVVELEFDGYAIGGVSVGEPEDAMMRAVESAEALLPHDQARYGMDR